MPDVQDEPADGEIQQQDEVRGRSMANRDEPNERIFFMVKYWILGGFESAVFLLVVLVLGSISFWQALYVGVALFFLPFVIGRYFEEEIDWAALKMAKGLDKRPRMKSAIVRYM